MKRVVVERAEDGTLILIIYPEWRPDTVYGYGVGGLQQTTIRVPLSFSDVDELYGDLRTYLLGAAA